MTLGPRRIAVVGRAGAGKTTIALRLGEALGIPVTHLDRLFWTPDWLEVDRAEFERRQLEVVEHDAWILDGGYLTSAGWPRRRARADLVMVAEAPLVVCLWRIVRRSILRRRSRPDRPGDREQFSPHFLWWTITWTRRHPRLAETLRAAGTPVVVARRGADVDALIGAWRAERD